MMDDLPKAYAAYQQALYHLQNPKVPCWTEMSFLDATFSSPVKEPKLWYGIGILYDRYGSFDHAEEAFTSVLKMDPKFEKANEIYFRLGIIYKQQSKYDTSLQVHFMTPWVSHRVVLPLYPYHAAQALDRS